MTLFSQNTFHQIFSYPQGKVKARNTSSAFPAEEKICTELNDNRPLAYENISQEELFMESLKEFFIPHIPPFNFEQKSASLYTLSVLMPGVDKKDIDITLTNKKVIIRVCSFRKRISKEESKKVFHQGIFDVLMPGIPFESAFEVPFPFHLKEYDLSEGILKLTFERKNKP